MIRMVAEFLRSLAPLEVEPTVSLLLGRPLPLGSGRSLEVSWATLSALIKRLSGVDWTTFLEIFNATGDLGSAVKEVFEKYRVHRQAPLFKNPLTIIEVRQRFEATSALTGQGSKEKKERLLEALLGAASPLEAKYLVRILIGEMRTGVHEGLMEQAVAEAFNLPLILVQRAGMVLGDVAYAAAAARAGGKYALLQMNFQPFRPVKPMLAQMAGDVAEALREHGGRTAFEYKLDGARVQIHKKGSLVKIFSRRLTDVSESLPDIVEHVKLNVKAEEAILEGEVIAVDKEGRPMPFQNLMRRFKRVHNIEMMLKEIPARLYYFDLIYLNGESFISAPYLQRRKLLATLVGEGNLTRQLITDKVQEAEAFLTEAVNAGHEGLMAKRLDSGYTPGVRGKHWLKIKPTLEPLDLVIVAAEYGYGRRHSWLSDYYLAARDAETGEYLVVGKTFKGLTDAEIEAMTEQLKKLAIKMEQRRVYVIPKIVVEVAYNEIQKSPKYKSGYALRFARITRIRNDKSPVEVDTLQRVMEIYEKQLQRKGIYAKQQKI